VLKKLKKKTKSFSHFIWLILLITISSFVTYFYDSNKKSQNDLLKKTLQNLYLQKVFSKITSKLEHRYTEFEYIIKEGDSYESIIYGIKIPLNEKKLFLEAVKKMKKLKY